MQTFGCLRVAERERPKMRQANIQFRQTRIYTSSAHIAGWCCKHYQKPFKEKKTSLTALTPYQTSGIWPGLTIQSYLQCENRHIQSVDQFEPDGLFGLDLWEKFYLEVGLSSITVQKNKDSCANSHWSLCQVHRRLEELGRTKETHYWVFTISACMKLATAGKEVSGVIPPPFKLYMGYKFIAHSHLFYHWQVQFSAPRNEKRTRCGLD